ncbi:MAG: PEP-CTERM sorting domain-containing protein [Phycisphaerae bacterium]
MKRMLGMLTFTITGLLTSPALAGKISAYTGSAGPGAVTGTAIVSPALNNDNSVGLSPNKVTIDATITDFHGGGLQMNFHIDDTMLTSEYAIKANLKNGTALPWDTLDVEVRYLHASGEFILPVASSGLDFDLPDRDPAPTSPNFFLGDPGNGVSGHYATLLEWNEGFPPGLATGATTDFNFSIDIPNWTAPFGGSALAGYTMQLRFEPTATVPEPGSLALIFSGVLAAIFRRRV